MGWLRIKRRAVSKAGKVQLVVVQVMNYKYMEYKAQKAQIRLLMYTEIERWWQVRKGGQGRWDGDSCCDGTQTTQKKF